MKQNYDSKQIKAFQDLVMKNSYSNKCYYNFDFRSGTLDDEENNTIILSYLRYSVNVYFIVIFK